MGAVVDMALYNVGSMWLYPKLGVFEGGCPCSPHLFLAQIALVVAHATSGPKTGSGCRATRFKYPSLWIQPPRTISYQAI